ncbi:glycoside hydrolase 5 family protein [Ruania alba]|uniref:Glycosyl hydrolase n=1 Tax=Ruania alba TaxID=648782 RepID=A0A1H5D598_9MICO|nr:glycosyl hydrolase [Ruania alba]SED74067.1 hypothetical protein SAMN04488554_0574 [Ruania alba]
MPVAATAPRFGVNYTPSVDWMFQWMALDPDVVRADFDAIARLGFDHVRVFPLWPVLQPNRTLIRQRAVEDVATVVELGHAAGLQVYVDVIQGHMSGFDFVPAWLVNWHRGNMFTDPGAIEAQARLATVLHDRLIGLPGFAGLTLGNETNQFVDDPNPDKMVATPEQVTAWLDAVIGPLAASSKSTIVHSTNDHAWYRNGHPFVPRHVTGHGTVSTVHSWIFNGTADRYGGLSSESVRHGEYLIELARAFADDVRRPIWLQEIGAPDRCLTNDEAPEFAVQSIEAALSTADLYGVTWWCSHDIGADLSDFKTLEYSLGLLRTDQTVKPIGRRIAEVIADARARPREVPARPTAVQIEVDDALVPLDRPSLGPGGAHFEAWHTLRADGVPAALVTSTDAQDPARLAERGIASVVTT